MKVLPLQVADEPFCPLLSAFMRRDLSLLEVSVLAQLLSMIEDRNGSLRDCKPLLQGKLCIFGDGQSCNPEFACTFRTSSRPRV